MLEVGNPKTCLTHLWCSGQSFLHISILVESIIMVQTILVKPSSTEHGKLAGQTFLFNREGIYLNAHFLTAVLLTNVLLAMVVVGLTASLMALAVAPIKDIFTTLF